MLVVSSLEFGGTQRQVVHLARALDRDRFEVDVCSLSDYVPLADGLHAQQLPLRIIKKRSKYDLAVPIRLYNLLRQRHTDIVHGFLLDAQIAARLAGRWAGAIVIDSERCSNYELLMVQQLAYRLTRSCVDLVITNSAAGAAFHRRIHGYPENLYRVIHNGVDTDRFHPGPADAVRKELGIATEAVVAGIFASFKPQKNHELFFRAAGQAVRDIPSLRLLVVGDELPGGVGGTAAQKQAMLELVEQLGLTERCLFVGNRTDVERLYSACDFVVLSSSFEGTPNAVIESLACGVPVIATDVGDCAQVLPDGLAGFIVPPGDTRQLAMRMKQLGCDRRLCKRLGIAGRGWTLRHFSLRALGTKTAKVYEESMHVRRGGRRNSG